MRKHDSLCGIWGNLGRIRGIWTLFTIVLADFIIVILIIFIVIRPGPLEIDVDRYLPNGRPEPWPVQPKPAAVAGCYELSFGDWKPKIDLGEDVYYVTAPPSIELTTEPIKRKWAEDCFVMRPAPRTESSAHSNAYWRITPSRTIYLKWSDGFCGLQAELGPIKGGELRGYAKTFWDFHRQEQVARVTARRSDCEGLRK